MSREMKLMKQMLGMMICLIPVCSASVTTIQQHFEEDSIPGARDRYEKNISVMQNDEANCQQYIKNMTCKWTRKSSYHFPISNHNPCNFSCQFDDNISPLSAIRMSVHLHYRNPRNNPTFVSVQQSRQISSWTLPITYHGNKSQIFTSLETLLCPPLHVDKTIDIINVQITTNHLAPVNISVQLTNVSLAMELGKNVSIWTTPTSPWFKLYSWLDGQQSVMILAESKASDSSKCAMLSIQNAQCPVGQDISGVRASGGRYQTFTERAGLVAYKRDFPDGIFIVLLPVTDSSLCKIDTNSKSKTVNLIVVEHGTIMSTWYIYGTTAVILIVLVMAFTLISVKIIERQFGEESENGDYQRLLVENGGMVFAATVNNLQESSQNLQSSGATSNSQTTGILGSAVSNSALISQISEESISQQNQQSPTHLAMMGSDSQPIVESQQIRAFPPSTLAPQNVDDITQQYNPSIFLWWRRWAIYEAKTSDAQVSEVGFQNNLFIMALFAALPTTELVRSYISVLMQSGNEDQCYFNSRCITGFWFIPDFSRVFTNIGYILASLGFYTIVKKHRKIMSRVNSRTSQDGGVSRHYGLWLSLAYGLAIQGVMSSLYHICPNSVTIRFDLMFMYPMSIILIVGIWGLRHGDVTHHVYPTIALVGVMLLMAEARDFLSRAIFWTIMGTLHTFFTITTTVLLYKYGTWNFSPRAMIKIWINWRPVVAKMNNSSVDALQVVRVITGLLLNIGLVIYSSLTNSEVYTHILMVCLSNLALYFINYILTKRFSVKERGSTLAWISILLSSILWILAVIAFATHITDSEATPSESRAKNQACMFFGVFDTHDAWHLTSSLALFTTFVGVLTLDDDLAYTSADKIPVF